MEPLYHFTLDCFATPYNGEERHSASPDQFLNGHPSPAYYCKVYYMLIIILIIHQRVVVRVKW